MQIKKSSKSITTSLLKSRESARKRKGKLRSRLIEKIGIAKTGRERETDNQRVNRVLKRLRGKNETNQDMEEVSEDNQACNDIDKSERFPKVNALTAFSTSYACKGVY